MSEQSESVIIWPQLVRKCVVDLIRILETNRSPHSLDLMAARLQKLLNDHQEVAEAFRVLEHSLYQEQP